jgi:hypothetical protein
MAMIQSDNFVSNETRFEPYYLKSHEGGGEGYSAGSNSTNLQPLNDYKIDGYPSSSSSSYEGGSEAYHDKYRIEYSILSISVLTLGILLVVEFVRHLLDHKAKRRIFFKTVLENVYSECK